MILVMLGVFGGAIAFGVIGMFLGPTLVTLGYNLLEQWSELDSGKNPAAISLNKTDQ
jgi:predicted PurR-regulated permease PerM